MAFIGVGEGSQAGAYQRDAVLPFGRRPWFLTVPARVRISFDVWWEFLRCGFGSAEGQSETESRALTKRSPGA